MTDAYSPVISPSGGNHFVITDRTARLDYAGHARSGGGININVTNKNTLRGPTSVNTWLRTNPEYAIQYILDAWREWAAKKDEPVKSANAAFRAFAKKYIEANPIW